MNNYSLQVLPGGSYSSPRGNFDWTVIVTKLSRSFSISLHRIEGKEESVTPEYVSALALDLLRPGWLDRVSIENIPTSGQNKIYRTFYFTDSSTLLAGSLWQVECVVQLDLFGENSWQDVIDFIDETHRYFAL